MESINQPREDEKMIRKNEFFNESDGDQTVVRIDGKVRKAKFELSMEQNEETFMGVVWVCVWCGERFQGHSIEFGKQQQQTADGWRKGRFTRQNRGKSAICIDETSGASEETQSGREQ